MRASDDRRTWGRLAALATLLLAGSGVAGCDAEPGAPEGAPAVDDAAGVPATALELGLLGEGRSFAPYEPGQVLEIHRGLQGGYHVFVDARLRGEALDDECLVTLRMFRVDDGSEVATIQHLREPDLLLDAEGNETLEELIVFIAEPEAVDGVEVRIEGALDFDDASLEGDEVLVRLRRAW